MEAGSAGYITYLKVLSNGDGERSPAKESRNRRQILVIVIIVTVTCLVIVDLIFVAFSYHRKNKILRETSQDASEDDNATAFLECLFVSVTVIFTVRLIISP